VVFLNSDYAGPLKSHGSTRNALLNCTARSANEKLCRWNVGLPREVIVATVGMVTEWNFQGTVAGPVGLRNLIGWRREGGPDCARGEYKAVTASVAALMILEEEKECLVGIAMGSCGEEKCHNGWLVGRFRHPAIDLGGARRKLWGATSAAC